MRIKRLAFSSLLLLSSLSSADEISFKQQVLPLLMKNCAVCHLKNERYGYLTIDEENSYNALVNVPSFTLPQMKRVDPGYPQKSYFWLKITGEHLRVGGKGWPMPYMSSLADKEKQAIYQWIKQGAKNN
jgi:hypothetical protein